MTQYLTAALNKRNSDRTMDYSLDLHEFICQGYINLAPNEYGKHVQEYISRRLDAINVKPSEERGDLMITAKYFEVKVSYLGQKNNSYNITHIRQWQNLDYYLLCFVDCDNNFTPNFFVVKKKIMGIIKQSYMNGTPKSNRNNDNIEMRATIKKYDTSYLIINNFNLLKDTTFESLQEFISDLRKNRG